jgi:uncharacterized membrane protein
MILLNLIFTIFLELFVLLIFFRKNKLVTFTYCVLINLFSWPLANLFFEIYSNLLVIELGVIIVESFFIMALFESRHFKAFLISLLSNSVSAIIGLFIVELIF